MRTTYCQRKFGLQIGLASILMLGAATVAPIDAAEAARLKVIHAFAGNDGGEPVSGLVANGDDLYGTTQFGGDFGDGVVFKVARDGTETVLHSFAGTDGNLPKDVIVDRGGQSLWRDAVWRRIE